ncbi:MAG: hypothetical protein Q8R04_01970, partial [Nanoarchaeota archaeon]|nr:hypothetical protein [Nanoarchaeota archaeon]
TERINILNGNSKELVLENREITNLEIIANSDIFWDKIKNMGLVEDDLYDFEIEDTHNFLISNGVVVHNSMMGVAMAELLPMEKLVDIISFPNPNDENQPLIRTMPAGQGRDFVAKAKMQSMNMFKNQNIILFVIIIASTLFPYFLYKAKKIEPVIYAASIIASIGLIGVFILSLNLGRRGLNDKIKIPRIIVDNFQRKKAPFNDATGAHAGALLGDVLHDPFQCFIYSDIYIKKDMSQAISLQSMQKTLDNLFLKNKEDIIKNIKGYEAIFLRKNELFVLGESNGFISPVEVLSCNRQNYNGKMIKLTTSTNKELIVTAEHKIAVNKNGKIAYKEAKDLKLDEEIISKVLDLIIDEQDIINTYDERQQEQCRLYYQYLDIKSKNPTWGYKKIAKAMGQNIGKTRWWHAKKHIPVPIQTANWLKSRNLLPLKADNPKLPLIAKVLGATFGDGGVFENLNGIFLSSSEKEAVEEFGQDLKEIFGVDVGSNHRVIEGGEKGHSWCYQNTNRNIIRFFLALGCPKGNKTKLALEIPNWIYLSDTFADEFFGSFFGGELGAPKVHKQKNRLQTLDLAITGTKELENNRINFLNKIKRYLEDKGVNSTSIIKKTTKNERLLLYRLLISIKFDNVANFINNVKINYCKYKKEKLVNAINEFRALKKIKYDELISRGYGTESAMRLLQLTPKSLYIVLNEEEITA